MTGFVPVDLQGASPTEGAGLGGGFSLPGTSGVGSGGPWCPGSARVGHLFRQMVSRVIWGLGLGLVKGLSCQLSQGLMELHELHWCLYEVT